MLPNPLARWGILSTTEEFHAALKTGWRVRAEILRQVAKPNRLGRFANLEPDEASAGARMAVHMSEDQRARCASPDEPLAPLDFLNAAIESLNEAPLHRHAGRVQ
jgi:hypothetical protein